MRLRTAHIRHYKSLQDVVVAFSDPITVLVGPNAVGKSNVVDCLRFVRDAVTTDLEHAVASRGGIGRLRQYSRTKPFKVGVRLEFEESIRETDHLARYEFAIESQTAGNYVVDAESANFVETKFGNSETLIKRRFARDRAGNVNFYDTDPPYRVAQDQLALGQFRGLRRPTAYHLESFITDWRYAEIHPNRLRELSLPDKDKLLSEDGRNWASVIKTLRRSARGKAMLERVFEAMKIVIPSFQDVSVTTVGSYLVPRFRFALGAEDKVEFDPLQLSDGTLRIFGLLLALYQSPSPQLLVIEEPEQAVHPGVLGVLADAFREAAERTQIVVTTHSPHFIDHFEPEQVRVVTLEEGLTKVSAVKRTQLKAVKERLMSMQDFMLAEGLLPEPT